MSTINAVDSEYGEYYGRLGAVEKAFEETGRAIDKIELAVFARQIAVSRNGNKMSKKVEQHPLPRSSREEWEAKAQALMDLLENRPLWFPFVKQKVEELGEDLPQDLLNDLEDAVFLTKEKVIMCKEQAELMISLEPSREGFGLVKIWVAKQEKFLPAELKQKLAQAIAVAEKG